MKDALRFEWVRLRTVRSTYWLVGLAAVLPALLTVLVGTLTREDSMDAAEAAALLTGGVALASALPLPAVLMGVLGVLSIGHEYRHGTIRPTLAALPRRSQVVVAKVALLALVSAVTAALGMALSYVLLVAIRGEVITITGDPVGALGGYVVLLVLWSLVGFAATLLTRQTALVLPALFVLPLLVEPMVSLLTFLPQLEWARPWTRFLPFNAGTQLAQTFTADLDPEIRPGAIQPLSRVENGAVFAAFAVLVLAPAWALFERRDA